MIRIQDYVDMNGFEQIIADWAIATGLAAVAIGTDGQYISQHHNSTEFCARFTKGNEEGRRRCEKCDRDGKGIYQCHAGLTDFSIDLIMAGEKVGAIVGGQVLPGEPDEEKFRAVAKELGINEDRYIEALHKVSVRTEKQIAAASSLLGQVLNNYINSEYERKHSQAIMSKLTDGVERAGSLIAEVTKDTAKLKSLQGRQKILARL